MISYKPKIHWCYLSNPWWQSASLKISRNKTSISANGLTKKPADRDEQVFSWIFLTEKLSNTSPEEEDHFMISVEQKLLSSLHPEMKTFD